MNSTRRNFLRQSVAVSLGFAGLSRYLNNMSEASPLSPDPSRRNWLELPEGFSAKIISESGQKMNDGFLVPARADGMAAFQVGQRVVLVRNHENSPAVFKDGPFGTDMQLFPKISRQQMFDYGFGKTPSMGGTTTVWFDEASQQVERQFLSLVGTNRNCAGGPTPWGSWITCEENTDTQSDKAEQDHGYNFEIPAAGNGLIEPIPLRGMGRFNHEAVCVDPRTGIVYQTEDRGDSLIYRFIPKEKGKLHMGGTLQALAIKGRKSFDTRNWESPLVKPGDALDVYWITMENIESKEDDLRLRGYEQGAAVFARGEGMWFGNNEVYFACTNGGAKKAGQVFKYIPSSLEGTSREGQQPGKLVLFAEPNNTDILKYCDNLTVAPWGDVIFVEDSPNAYMRGITPEGRIYNIARNVGSSSELAGVCFSPSGNTLFVNIQDNGLTMAITGPWKALRG